MMKFDEREKRRQADFRDTSPHAISGISDRGRSPSDDMWKRTKHGYMLALGYEHENLYKPLRVKAGALDFFADRGIKWWSGGYDRAGNWPTRYMNCSQIMCVNFMLPLAEIDGALVAALRAIDGDVERVAPIEHDGRKALVEFEWIGIHKSLEMKTSRGWRTTSIDAFVIAETSAGERRAYLLEWKYAESSSGKPEGGNRGQKQVQTYSDLYYAESSSFNGNTPMEDLFYDPIDQLMRNRLLADRMVANAELKITDAKTVSVVPDENKAYRNTPRRLLKQFPTLGDTVSDVFRATLKDSARAFAEISPARLLEAVERECSEAPAISDWAAYMRKRYGL